MSFFEGSIVCFKVNSLNLRFEVHWWHRLIFALLLLTDSYIGLVHGLGVVTQSGLFKNEVKWILLSLEMFSGFVILIRVLIKQISSRWRTYFVIATPIIVVLIGFIVVEFLLTGLNRSATINLNISSIGLSGLYWTAAYLSIAIGLTLTYKVQRFANFAQAEMMLVGAYVALTLMWSDFFFPISNAKEDGILSWELLVCASVTGFIVAGLFGLLIDRLVYRKLRNILATPQVMMIASLGVAMVIRALLFIRFGAGTFRFIPDKDWRLGISIFEIPTKRLQLQLGDNLNSTLIQMADNVSPYGFAYTKLILVMGMCIILTIVLIVLYRTLLGRQMRAVSDNPGLAASSGIHVEKIHGSTAFLSSGIAGFGGVLLALILPINPELGLSLLLPAFAVIVLGTIGSVPGVIFGALIIGFLRASSEPVLIGLGNALDRPTASGFAEVVPFVFLVGILLLAPKGIGSAFENWNIARLRKRREIQRTPITDHFPSVVFSVQKVLRIGKQKDFIYKKAFFYKENIFGNINELVSLICSIVRRYLNLIFSRLGLVFKCIFIEIPFPKVVIPDKFKIDRETERGSWIAFLLFFLILVLMVWILPSVNPLTKTMQVARICILLGIFSLASFSLNLHTGITGMTNFGVIFFVGIGSVTVGLLSAPVETNGYGWSPLLAAFVGMLIAACIGWLLAYPTARLRMDYFAIVTISLGEMLRISLQAEPLLRAGTVTSAIGISQYSRPLENWWDDNISEHVGSFIGLSVPAPYVVFLAFFTILSVLLVWFVLEKILGSPWGRILRSIREDEVVSQHHGHNILTHKAASLALGAMIAALAGALWAWLNTNVWPDFMNPVRSTFLIWAAFIVGGRGNNKGMIIGAFVIVLVEFLFNVMVASRGAASLPLHTFTFYLDKVFSWIVVDLGGLIWSDRSIREIFPNGNVLLSLSHFKLGLIGLVILGSLMTSSKGLLPEVPGRPKRPHKQINEVEI